LRRITDRYDTLPAAAEAWALQARDYVARADKPVVPADSNGYWKARVICEKVLGEAKASSGQAICSDLLHTILQQQLNLITEGVNIPNKPFRALLTWQNFSRLYLRVIRLDKPLNENSSNIQDSAFQKRLLAMPVYRSAELSLPKTTDLRAHRV